MNILMRRQPHAEPADPPPETLDLIRLHTRQMERSRQLRDAAIAQARTEKNATLRDIAEAAGLSISRIKQINPLADPRAKLKSPVTEVDILAAPASSSADPSDERVLALDDVDPYLPTWPSERAFIDADERRYPFMDLFGDLYDGDSQESWHLRYCRGTHEVYAWTDRTPDPAYVDDPSHGGPAESGPCIVLGHVYSWELLERCLDRSLRHVTHRPGGLAWAYGRIQLLNRVLDALSRDYRSAPSESLLTYLTDTLPESEQPR